MMSQCHSPKASSRKKFCLCLTIRTTAEYISSNSDSRWDERPGSGRSPQSEHPPSTRRMVMSGSAMLAPREDSDSAIGQEAAGDAAGEKAVDRYRTWVGDHRVSAALLAGLVATHLATVVGYFMPGVG